MVGSDSLKLLSARSPAGLSNEIFSDDRSGLYLGCTI